MTSWPTISSRLQPSRRSGEAEGAGPVWSGSVEPEGPGDAAEAPGGDEEAEEAAEGLAGSAAGVVLREQPTRAVAPRMAAVTARRRLGRTGRALVGESGGRALVGESGGRALVGESGGRALVGESGGRALVGESGGRALVGRAEGGRWWEGEQLSCSGLVSGAGGVLRWEGGRPQWWDGGLPWSDTRGLWGRGASGACG
ncbi:hypothetical protein [Actinomyces wuliandei]|uniref:hypothetical protein n=1 Tax=Actinomyces wuliandei TaxID=2057743 RepID=UPI001FAA5B4B|nr:hypothetical protein [Actinomyces wuliandei]